MTPTDQERAPDDVRALIERAQGRLREAAIWATDRLGDASWRPQRYNIEGMRNTMSDATDDLARALSTPTSSPVAGEGEPQLSKDERSVLEWLAKEDTSAYGECHGAALDGLVEKGLAILHRDSLGRSREYDRVSVTERGHQALAPSRPPEPAASGEQKPAVWIPKEQFSRLSEPDLESIASSLWTRPYKDKLLPLYTHPPEGNVRVLRETLKEARDILNGHGFYVADFDKALALPADDDHAKATPGDMEPHNNIEKTVAVVRAAYGWQVDKEGRLYGLVGGDMGYAATSIVLGEDDRWENPKSSDDQATRIRAAVIEECAKVAERIGGPRRGSHASAAETSWIVGESIAASIRALSPAETASKDDVAELGKATGAHPWT